MMKILQSVLLAIFLTSGWSTFAQSEINITYNGNPIDLKEGIDLSKVTYPLVRLEFSSDEEVRQKYSHLELTIVRGGRAVYSQRRNEKETGGKVRLKSLLDHARPGDEIQIRIGRSRNLNASKIISFPVS